MDCCAWCKQGICVAVLLGVWDCWQACVNGMHSFEGAVLGLSALYLMV
jgi:hypothetical protein